MYQGRGNNAYYDGDERLGYGDYFDDAHDNNDGRYSGRNARRSEEDNMQFDDIRFSQRDNFQDDGHFPRYDPHDDRYDGNYLHPVSSKKYRDRDDWPNYAHGNQHTARDDYSNRGERIEMTNLYQQNNFQHYDTQRDVPLHDHQFQGHNDYYEDNVPEDFRQSSEFETRPNIRDERSYQRERDYYNSRPTDGGQGGYGRSDDQDRLYHNQHDFDNGHGNPGFEIEADYEDTVSYRPRAHRNMSMRRRSRKSHRERRHEDERNQRISFADGMKTLIQRRKANEAHRPVSEINFRSRQSRPESVFGSVSPDYDEDEDKLPSNKYHKRKTLKYRLATLQKERPVTSHDMATLLRDQVLTREVSTLKGWELRKYQMAMQWQRFTNWVKSMVYELELWAGAFKVIEGHFGTSTVSYFRFLRWLMFLNLFMTLFMFSIVLLPFLLLEPRGDGSFTAAVNACSSVYHNEAVFYSSNYTNFVNSKVERSNTADKIQDVLQGTGWMENTVLFYGVFYSKTGYNMSLAYLFAVGVSFLLCFILLVKNSAKGFKQSAVSSVSGNITLYCNKIFGAWDYCISDPKTAHLKHSNILQDIKNELEYQRLQWKKASRTTKEKLKLYTVRFVINILVILILGGALYLIYFVNQQLVELEKADSLSETVALIMQFLPSVTIMLLSVIVPTVFNKVVIAEDYMPAFSIRITLIRTVLLRLASLGILMISLYTTLKPKKKNLGALIPCDNLEPSIFIVNTTTVSPIQSTTVDENVTLETDDKDLLDNSILCWETYFGQQIYKLVMLNFIVVILVTFGWEFPRKFIYGKLHTKIKVVELVGLQTFDLSKNVLDLVYLQTLCWLGVFFSPIIPAMCFVKCFIFFYVKKGSLLTNCLPTQQYGTTKSNSLFMMVLLLSFFLASIPIIYMIGSIPPSQGCGPFRVYSSENYIMFDAITNLVESDSKAKEIFSVVATPAFMAVLAFCLCILMYYFWIVGQANYNLSKSLKEQLKIEGQDKQFLVARVNEAYAYEME